MAEIRFGPTARPAIREDTPRPYSTYEFRLLHEKAAKPTQVQNQHSPLSPKAAARTSGSKVAGVIVVLGLSRCCFGEGLVSSVRV